MRTEKEMHDLILEVARKEEAVRVVVMNGSRVNPNARQDPFQDFDFRFFVSELEPFIQSQAWIDQFGKRIILQTPEAMGDAEDKKQRNQFSYLMLFTDGNRIDLSISPLTDISRIGKDSLTALLLDKDGLVGPLPAPSDKSYSPTPPTAKAFEDCCNEFWWVSTYVAKALWRRNLYHAKDLLDCAVREQLMKMLDWYFGMRTNFEQNPGKGGRNYSKVLDSGQMEILKKTYTGLDIEDNWDALFTMCSLFRNTARKIAGKFDLSYPEEDDKKVTAHLEHVRRLLPDAKEIY